MKNINNCSVIPSSKTPKCFSNVNVNSYKSPCNYLPLDGPHIKGGNKKKKKKMKTKFILKNKNKYKKRLSFKTKKKLKKGSSK